ISVWSRRDGPRDQAALGGDRGGGVVHGNHGRADVDDRTISRNAQAGTDLPARHAHGDAAVSAARDRAGHLLRSHHTASRRPRPDTCARGHSRRDVRERVSRRAVAVRLVPDDAGGGEPPDQPTELRVLDGAGVCGADTSIRSSRAGRVVVWCVHAARLLPRDSVQRAWLGTRRMDAPCAAVKRRAFGAVLIPALWLVASAHVGSPDVVYDGSAGAYAVRVIVRPPNVVPGLADVVVRVNASDARRVTIQPVFWKTGVSGAPIGDEARRVAGEANLYSGQVWLMSRGAYSVYVNVEGARGSGTAVVPVNSIATARLGMSPFLGGILVVLGGVLIAGLITIVRAAAGEGVLPPGQVADASVRRRANRFALIATPLFAVLVFGGAKWWNTVDAAYRRTMFRPPAVDVALSANGLLQLNVHDTASYRALFAPVVPDHGKMMHLFIVSEPDHLVFAHLNPVQGDSLHFSTTLPPLPAGHYRLFGDLTIETGASFTV